MTTNKMPYLIYIMVLTLPACKSYAQPQQAVAEEPIIPLPETLTLNHEKVILGEKLFNDKRLSEGKLSCASCHQLSQGGASGHKTDTSHGNSAFQINTPSIFNVSYNFRQNWDGSDYSLKSQLVKIFSNHAPFNSSLKTIIIRLEQDKELNQQFKLVYKNGLNKENLLDSMVEFEKSLVTPNSKFDQYLKGNKQALSANEIKGYHLFKKLGCISCHQGINIGGNLFQKFGIFYNYLAQRSNITNADFGRINTTGRESDKSVFKVPSLRNVALTAPYLHDGNARTLEDAIFLVGKTQLGRTLDNREIKLLKTFLLTLTGEYKNTLLVDKNEK